MENSSDSANISSAEMTAYWRSLFPRMSHDIYSINLASKQGILKAKEFEEKFNYPLVGRKVSTRAGFIHQKAVDLLSTGKYDACISLASGFSLLTYCIKESLGEKAKGIVFYDTDLSHMIEERKKRIHENFDPVLSQKLLNASQHKAFDLEEAAKNRQSLQDFFPCQSPLFIVEGVIYFLSEICVDWFMEKIKAFKTSSLIFDYWPEDGVNKSACFKRVVDSLKGFIPETIKSFWAESSIQELSQSFSLVQEYQIDRIEQTKSEELSEKAQFNNPDAFFPVKFIVAVNNQSLNTIPSRFSNIVSKFGKQTAVIDKTCHLTYEELDTLSTNLAHYFISIGIKKNDIVGICLLKSYKPIITMLALLKVGTAYLPISTEVTQSRFQYVIDNSGCKFFMFDSFTYTKYQLKNCEKINLDLVLEETKISTNPKVCPQSAYLDIETSLNDIAYVIYTSGTTGKAKGVQVNQKAILNLTQDPEYVTIHSTDALLQLSPLEFDGSTFEIWGALLNGAKLVLMPAGWPELEIIADKINQHHISIMFITTQLFNSLVDHKLDSLLKIKQLYFGSEQASIEHVQKFMTNNKNCKLYNIYGPTECTTFSTCFPITKSVPNKSIIPIGKPINDRVKTVVISQNNGKIISEGIGELYISGDGLASGYLNDHALTAQKFVNLSETQSDAIFFQTGDIVNILEDGNLVF